MTFGTYSESILNYRNGHLRTYSQLFKNIEACSSDIGSDVIMRVVGDAGQPNER